MGYQLPTANHKVAKVGETFGLRYQMLIKPVKLFVSLPKETTPHPKTCPNAGFIGPVLVFHPIMVYRFEGIIDNPQESKCKLSR